MCIFELNCKTPDTHPDEVRLLNIRFIRWLKHLGPEKNVHKYIFLLRTCHFICEDIYIPIFTGEKLPSP